MFEEINSFLLYEFKRYKKRHPNEKELKKIKTLSSLYTRDLKNILKMEIKDTF